MKIWIISSPPFLKDFEKISSNWVGKNEITITPIINFGINVSGINGFNRLFKEISPDVILTDHGHPFFWILRIKKFWGFKIPPVFVFLRGNYWLESKKYSIKVNRKTIYNLSIRLAKNKTAELIGPNNTVYNYVTLAKNNNFKNYVFGNIIPGKYNLRISQSNEKVEEISFLSPFNFNDNELLIKTSAHIDKPRRIHEIREWIRLRFFKFGWSQLFKISKKLIPVCDYLRKEAEKHTTKPIEICPIGIDQPETKSEFLELVHPSVCIIQNHQIKEKSDALINFLPVIKSLPKITFYISLGNPENRDNENFKKVFETFNNLKNVIFTEINSTNRDSYLANTDLYALISGLDCTPATIIEASMIGKPILASNIGGIPEMIKNGETGWVIKNEDTKQWKEKIILLTSNKSLSEKIGTAAKKHAIKNYSTPIIADKLLRIITEK